MSIRGISFSFSWWRGLAFVVACSAVGTLAWWIDVKQGHSAVTNLEFDPRSVGKATGVTDAGRTALTREFLATQAIVMTSRVVCQRAAEVVSAAQSRPEGQRPEDRDRLAGRLCDRLEARRLGDSLVMELRYHDEDPDRARGGADALADAYVQRMLALHAGMSQPTAAYWTGELQIAEAALELSEGALAAFMQQHGIAALDTEQALATSALNAYSVALTEARIRRVQASAKVAQLEGLSKEGVLAAQAQDELVKQLRVRVKQLESEQQKLTLSGGEQHPQLHPMRAELANARAQLAEASREVLVAARSELAATEKEERDLQRNLEQAQATSLKVAALQVDYARLKRAESRDEILRSAVLGRISKAGDAPDSEGWVVRVLSRARTVSRGTVFPFALALCGLCGAACFLGWSRPRTERPSESST